MTILRNTAEGGSDGTTVTTGNSGGSSGDAFDVVTIAAGQILRFASAAAFQGALGYECATTTTGQIFGEWDLVSKFGAAQDELWYRVWRKVPAAAAASHNIFRLRAPTTLNHLIRTRINFAASLRRFQVLDADGTVQWTSTMEEPVNAWYRMETYWSKTQARVKLWSTDPLSDGTPDEDSGDLNFDFGSDLGEDAAWWSFGGNPFTTTNYGTDYTDGIALSNQGWIGSERLLLGYLQGV